MLYVVGGGTDHLPLTYQWFGPNGFTSTNDSISNLIAGTYSVTILDSNLCASNTSFDISTPDDLQYTTTGVLRNESCEGSCNGQLEISLVGGTPLHVGVSTNTTTGVQLTSTMIGDSILPNMCSGTPKGCSEVKILGIHRHFQLPRYKEKKVSFWDIRLWAVFGACPAALGRAGWITRVLGVAKRPEMTRVLPRDRFATRRASE